MPLPLMPPQTALRHPPGVLRLYWLSKRPGHPSGWSAQKYICWPVWSPPPHPSDGYE